MYFYYLLKKYIFNFLILFFGLSFLFVVVDYTLNFSKLPSYANLQILYIVYTFVYAAFMLYPLSFVFGFLLTLLGMIKSNELVSFYSLGFSPKKLFKPFLFVSFGVTLVMFLLQSTKVAYVNQYAQAIKAHMKYSNKDLFLKFNNYVVYIKELNPILKIAKEMIVFDVDKFEVKRVFFLDKAVFRNDIWIGDAKEVVLTPNKWIFEKKKVSLLEHFKPKIISNLKKLDNISFYDAYLSIKYFKEIDLNRILSIVFFKIVTPLSLIFFMGILFYKTPIHSRISNIPAFMIKSILLTIALWGSELIIYKFAKQGVLPYYLLWLPFVVVLILYFYVRRDND